MRNVTYYKPYPGIGKLRRQIGVTLSSLSQSHNHNMTLDDLSEDSLQDADGMAETRSDNSSNSSYVGDESRRERPTSWISSIFPDLVLPFPICRRICHSCDAETRRP